jgi:hypothetical protein
MSPKLSRVASPERSRRTLVAWPAGVGLLATAALILFSWGWTRGTDARVLAHLPVDERARLFQVTRAKAEAFCADAQLVDRCRAEVDLLAEFPECDAGCRSFVARNHPRGSR